MAGDAGIANLFLPIDNRSVAEPVRSTSSIDFNSPLSPDQQGKKLRSFVLNPLADNFVSLLPRYQHPWRK